jgi:replicative DNA helicase
VDVVAVSGQLGNGPEAGGLTRKLSEILGSNTSSSNLGYYLEIVNAKYILRQIISNCTRLASVAYEPNTSSEELLDEAERDILAIRPNRSKSSPDIKALVRAALTDLERIYTGEPEGGLIPTEFTDLDRLCGGLRPSEVTIVAGFPGSGKTSFAMNIAERAMLSQHRPVAVFSLEMSSQSLVQRFICSHAKVNLRNLASGKLLERDFRSLVASATDIGNGAIYFDDESDLSIDRLRAKARRIWQQHAIQLLVVDYLQLLTCNSTRKAESRQQEVADISRGLKNLARELRIPVLALSQLNDDGQLRESRAIGQDADNVWRLETVTQEDEDPSSDPSQAGQVDLVIKKARNGPVGRVPLTFLRCFTCFENAAKTSTSESQRSGLPYVV